MGCMPWALLWTQRPCSKTRRRACAVRAHGVYSSGSSACSECITLGAAPTAAIAAATTCNTMLCTAKTLEQQRWSSSSKNHWILRKLCSVVPNTCTCTQYCRSYTCAEKKFCIDDQAISTQSATHKVTHLLTAAPNLTPELILH